MIKVDQLLRLFTQIYPTKSFTEKNGKGFSQVKFFYPSKIFLPKQNVFTQSNAHLSDADMEYVHIIPISYMRMQKKRIFFLMDCTLSFKRFRKNMRFFQNSPGNLRKKFFNHLKITVFFPYFSSPNNYYVFFIT